MDQPDSKLETPFDSDASWDFLSDLLGQFCDQWEQAPPEPEFGSFAQQLASISDSGFRRVGLIELVKVEFEFRSQDQFQFRNLEFYLENWPEIGSVKNPPAELLAEQKRYEASQDNGMQGPSLMREFQPEATQTMALHRARAAHEFSPGDSIDDFDLLSRLGRGAFATVFLARQNSMQRLVALKISADEGLEGPTLAKLNHAHVVRVFDQRVIEEKSLRLMYMEYVAGGSLGDVIKNVSESEGLDSRSFLDSLDQNLADRGSSPPVESLNRKWISEAQWPQVVSRTGSQLASAIEYTHGRGVLHRDIKPANILLDADGYPKLVDFNISFGQDVVGASAASCFGGTLIYMSPEQLEAFHPVMPRKPDDIDGSCDVYALGATLYEMLTCERPFPNTLKSEPLDLIDEMIIQRKSGLQNQQVESLQANGHLLGTVIEASLAPDPKDRPSPKAMSQHLQWAADNSINEFLEPSESKWHEFRSLILRFPWCFIVAMVFGVAIFATWFIITYNVTESVLPSDQELFLTTRQWVNRVVFPLAFVVLVFMFHAIRTALKANTKTKSPNVNFESAIDANLAFGNRAAIMVAGMWIIAGMLYPIVLSARGANLESKAWVDFIASHAMAGLISAAFTYFGLTIFTVSTWHPRLVRQAIKQGSSIGVLQSIKRIRDQVYFYRVVAIGVPLIAIAVLVNFRDSIDYAVSFLSVAAICGLLAMARAIATINRSLSLIERMESR